VFARQGHYVFEPAWDLIGQLITTFSPEECAN
jgi:hypothetical protein